MVTWNQRRNQNQDQGGKEANRPRVHISLEWRDGHAWYQLATLLSRTYCMASSHVSRMKHAKEGGM
jgi:hypothetical protein